MQDRSEELQTWFSLSYASWLTIPRVLMESMPKEWQDKMAALLFEYDEAFPNMPDYRTYVSLKRDGKFVKPPRYLIDYRHPDRVAIDDMRNRSSS